MYTQHNEPTNHKSIKSPKLLRQQIRKGSSVINSPISPHFLHSRYNYDFQKKVVLLFFSFLNWVSNSNNSQPKTLSLNVQLCLFLALKRSHITHTKTHTNTHPHTHTHTHTHTHIHTIKHPFLRIKELYWNVSVCY